MEVYIAISKILSGIDKASYQVVIDDITELELARTKLYESEKKSLIQRMARVIGHEVRNPLTNIVLATEEMKDDFNKNEDALLMLNMIHRNASRISDLIDNFLDNTKSSEAIRKKVNIETVIKNAVNHCIDRILLKEIEYTLKELTNNTEVTIDPDSIQVVLTNIIINAAEALDSIEDPKLSISLKNNERYVEITIKDNGIGMTEETINNIFQPFYSSKSGGLGLGMANSKNILDEHAARITVESELNIGTAIKIEIPRNYMGN